MTNNKKYCSHSCSMLVNNPMHNEESKMKNKGIFKKGHKIKKTVLQKISKTWFKKGNKSGWNGPRRSIQEKTLDKNMLLLGFEKEKYIGVGKGYRKKFNATRFILDFYHDKYKLGIEIDGNSHHGKENYEKIRDSHIYRVHKISIIRFDVKHHFYEKKIIAEVKNVLKVKIMEMKKGQAAMEFLMTF